LRPRPKGPEAKAEAEARGYEAETEAEAKILAPRPVWPRGFNISDLWMIFDLSDTNSNNSNITAIN